MRVLTSFAGKNWEFRSWLAAQGGKKPDYRNVIVLGKCELCGRLAKGDICRQCEPMFRRWTKKSSCRIGSRRKKQKRKTVQPKYSIKN